MSDWNRKVEESIRREKREAELRYGIKIGQTEIYCARCGKKWDFTGNNGCKGALAHLDMLPEEISSPGPLFEAISGI